MLDQMIVMIYENYSEAMGKAASEEARHLGGLSRILVGKRSNSEDLLPAFDARLEAELNRLFGPQSDSADVRELANLMLDLALRQMTTAHLTGMAKPSTGAKHSPE